jgi:hypothetical protein
MSSSIHKPIFHEKSKLQVWYKVMQVDVMKMDFGHFHVVLAIKS